MTRMSNQEYFMNIAIAASSRSTCPRADVGAVIVKDNRIISTGYNGSPAGHKHCTEDGCYMVDNHCLRAVHAEANAICSCAMLGMETKDAEIYVTHFPCIKCFHQIIQSGITKVFYLNDYSISEYVLEMAFRSKIQLLKIKLEEIK